MDDQKRMVLGAVAFLAAMHAADGVTTALSLQAGAKEMNFYMATADGISWRNFMIIKCLALGVFSGLTALLYKLVRVPALAAIPCIIEGGRTSMASLNNLIVLFAQNGWL